MPNPYANKPASRHNVASYLQYAGVPSPAATDLVDRFGTDIDISASAESDTFYIAERVLAQAHDDDLTGSPV